MISSLRFVNGLGCFCEL